MNGDEEEIDCGGPDCDVCPTCDDGLWNGDEDGLDCGGTNGCTACHTICFNIGVDIGTIYSSWYKYSFYALRLSN